MPVESRTGSPSDVDRISVLPPPVLKLKLPLRVYLVEPSRSLTAKKPLPSIAIAVGDSEASNEPWLKIDVTDAFLTPRPT